MGNIALPIVADMAKNTKVDVKLEGKYAAGTLIAVTAIGCVTLVVVKLIDAYCQNAAQTPDYKVVGL